MNFSDLDLLGLVKPRQVTTWVKYLNSGTCPKTRSIELRNKLVEMNKGLINKQKSGDEHLGEWVENLIGAVERFDPKKGFAFSTFARGSMGRGQRTGTLIALPNYLRDNIAKINKALANNPDATNEELAAITDLSPQQVKTAQEAGRLTVQRLYARNPSGEVVELDPADPNANDEFGKIFAGEDLRDILSKLDPNESRFVTRLLAELEGDRSLREACAVLGIKFSEAERLLNIIGRKVTAERS